MFDEKPWSSLSIWFKKHQLWLSFVGLIFSIGAALILIFYYWWQINYSPFFSADKFVPNSTFSSPNLSQITVSITGAVLHPGIYRVEDGAIVADLIKIAGGFSNQADSQTIAQDFNLVDQLKDGQQLFIPSINSKSISTNISNYLSQDNSTISLNTATVEELDTLAGIGEKRAQDIIDHRPFSSVQELVTKKILTANQLEKVVGQLSL